MLDFLYPKTTMSIPEFLAFDRGEITLKEIRVNHQVETFIDYITRNKRAEKFLVFFTASVLYTKEVFAASLEGGGIDGLGWKLLGLIRHWGYWILIIMCILEIIRAAIKGKNEDILKIIAKFLIIFASMYLVPEIFDAIRDAFKK